jgi:phage baseplate assembly protein V
MIGKVVAIDEVTCKVRVEFPDRDDGDGKTLVSDWLPVGQKKTLGDLEYWLPDLDTQVACLMDDLLEAGVVICAIYSDADPPPVTNKDLYYRRFKDGTVIQYDRAGHKLLADIKGDIEVKATGKADVTIAGKTTWSSDMIDLNGGGAMAGCINGLSMCHFMGNPHADISTTVKVSK